MDDYVEVYATITDRWNNVYIEYAGSIPEWHWEDKRALQAWKNTKRAFHLSEHTTDPIGWTVRFNKG